MQGLSSTEHEWLIFVVTGVYKIFIYLIKHFSKTWINANKSLSTEEEENRIKSENHCLAISLQGIFGIL